MGCIVHMDPPPGVRVRFVSDWHLGHERSEAPGVDRLEPLLIGVDVLVVAGDLAETRPCPWQQRGKALREELVRLCQRRKVSLVLIAGNHDPDVEALAASFWGGKVVAMHGHALYKEVAPWSWEYLHHKKACKALIRRYSRADTDVESRLELSRAVCQLSPPMMKREGVSIPLVSSFLHCFWPPMRPLRIVMSWLTCARKARRFARDYFPHAQVLVFGHMHRSGAWRFPDVAVYNTGAWFRHATPYALDMIDAEVVSYVPLGSLLS